MKRPDRNDVNPAIRAFRRKGSVLVAFKKLDLFS